jgi:endonuclease V-like protein UPF0215 family
VGLYSIGASTRDRSKEGGTMDFPRRGAMLAVDDGYFQPEYKSLKGYAPVVGVIGYKSRIYGIVVKMLLVDSPYIEDLLIDIYSEAIRLTDKVFEAVVCDNVIYGGFSVYDPWRLNERIGVPIIVVFDHPLDLTRIKAALESHFEDYIDRYNVIERSYKSSRVVATPKGYIRMLCIGLKWDICLKLIADNQTYHPLPQPLRHADVIASAIGRALAMRSSSAKM